MKLEYRDGLLFASLTLAHGGRAVTVDNVIVDTGAADTIVDIIAVEPLQLPVDEDDVIVRMASLGGFDYAVRKTGLYVNNCGIAVAGKKPSSILRR